MRIHLHDFSGHPFQVQLSRALARRGHTVRHTYCPQYVSGHGRLAVGPDDPAGLSIEAITAPCALQRYSPVARLRFERAYADAFSAACAGEPADVVLACNIPLFAHARIAERWKRAGTPWVFWHQDVYSAGIGDEARRALPGPVGAAAARMAERTERRLVADATAVVPIGAPFLSVYRDWGLRRDRVEVVPNWAPLDEISPAPRNSDWSRAQDLPDGLRLLYAGTLGRKHNPDLLVDLHSALRARGVDASLVVASEGVGADRIRELAGGAAHVRLLPFQPAEELPALLGAGDVLVALLEPSAANFSIPSKVLSYLAAGRPVLALAPPGNPAMRQILEAGGFVAAPDASGVRAATEWLAGLAADRALREELGRQARMLAETRFDIEAITDRFERILSAAAGIRRVEFRRIGPTVVSVRGNEQRTAVG